MPDSPAFAGLKGRRSSCSTVIVRVDGEQLIHSRKNLRWCDAGHAIEALSRVLEAQVQVTASREVGHDSARPWTEGTPPAWRSRTLEAHGPCSDESGEMHDSGVHRNDRPARDEQIRQLG